MTLNTGSNEPAPVLAPRAIFPLPVVQLYSELKPSAVLFVQLVMLCIARVPNTEFQVSHPTPEHVTEPVKVVVPARLALRLSAVVTKAVVASAVVLLPSVCVVAIVPVGRVGVPVKVGEARFAFSVSSSLIAVCTLIADIPHAGVLSI